MRRRFRAIVRGLAMSPTRVFLTVRAGPAEQDDPGCKPGTADEGAQIQATPDVEGRRPGKTPPSREHLKRRTEIIRGCTTFGTKHIQSQGQLSAIGCDFTEFSNGDKYFPGS